MGIEKLTGSLIEEANREAAEIVKTAQWHIEKMLSEEKSRESGLRENAAVEVNARLSEQKGERIAWARLEAKRIISEAREDAISNSLEDFFSALKEERKSPQYRDFLVESVNKASQMLGKAVIVHVAKSDAQVLGKLEGSKVIADLDCLGGAIVESADCTVRIDLRLETLFELKRDNLRKQIYDQAFSKS